VATNKHFTLLEIMDIQQYLNGSLSFKSIGKELCLDCTTIAKEIKNHITVRKPGSYGKPFNNCLHRLNCNSICF